MTKVLKLLGRGSLAIWRAPPIGAIIALILVAVVLTLSSFPTGTSTAVTVDDGQTMQVLTSTQDTAFSAESPVLPTITDVAISVEEANAQYAVVVDPTTTTAMIDSSNNSSALIIAVRSASNILENSMDSLLGFAVVLFTVITIVLRTGGFTSALRCMRARVSMTSNARTITAGQGNAIRRRSLTSFAPARAPGHSAFSLA